MKDIVKCLGLGIILGVKWISCYGCLEIIFYYFIGFLDFI